jgi:hypothetical protein
MSSIMPDLRSRQARSSALPTSRPLERLADLEAEWDALRAELDAITSTDIAAVNRWARDNTM